MVEVDPFASFKRVAAEVEEEGLSCYKNLRYEDKDKENM